MLSQTRNQLTVTIKIQTYQGHPGYRRTMLCRLEGRLNSQRVTSLVLLLTIHDHLHILDQAVDHLQGLRGSHLGLLMGEPI